MHHLTFCGTRTSGPWWPMTPDDDNHLSMKLSGLLEMSHARLRAQEMEQGWASPGQKHRLLGELLPQLRGRRVSVQEAVDVIRPTLQETRGERACVQFYANNYNIQSVAYVQQRTSNSMGSSEFSSSVSSSSTASCTLPLFFWNSNCDENARVSIKVPALI